MDDFLQICYNVDLYFGPRPTPAAPVALLPSYEDNPPDSVLKFHDSTGTFVLFLETRTTLSVRPFSPDTPEGDPDPLCSFRELGQPQADDTPFGQINVSFFLTEIEPDGDQVLSNTNKCLSDKDGTHSENPSANPNFRLTLMTERVHEHIVVDLATISNGDLDTIAYQTGHLLDHGGSIDFLPRVKNGLTRLWAQSTGNKKLRGAGDERIGRLLDCLDQLKNTQYWDIVFDALMELQFLLDERNPLSSSSSGSLSQI